LQARGRSPLYEEFSQGVAGDPDVLALLCELPEEKRQPNLLLGVVRFLYDTQLDYSSFRRVVVGQWGEIAPTMLARRTQTNEVARCATLLPLLLTLPQPLALFEVGASAGLCLLADRFRYDYDEGVFGPKESPVTLHCERRGAETPLPTRVPEIAWRAGCDLNPIDVRDEEAVRWLEMLIWPGEDERRTRLRGAVEIARNDPPRLFSRDLRQGIGDLVADAPRDATLVIFHSAVLTYVPTQDRRAFVDEVADIGATWIANEGADVFPSVRRYLDDDESEAHLGDFLLSCDGAPIGWTDSHGNWVQWRAEATPRSST
jgi:hypothetical protein